MKRSQRGEGRRQKQDHETFRTDVDFLKRHIENLESGGRNAKISLLT